MQTLTLSAMFAKGLRGASTARVEDYGYDALLRLTSATRPAGNFAAMSSRSSRNPSEDLGRQPEISSSGSLKRLRGRKGRYFGLLTVVLTIPVVVFVEATLAGPYTTAFNQSLYRKAKGLNLVGAPENRVIEVLGPADAVHERPPSFVKGPGSPPRQVGSGGRTYDYYPYPFLPLSKFQVHCADGRVGSVEMFDD